MRGEGEPGSNAVSELTWSYYRRLHYEKSNTFRGPQSIYVPGRKPRDKNHVIMIYCARYFTILSLTSQLSASKSQPFNVIFNCFSALTSS